MKKADVILAQKTIAARQVREESEQIKKSLSSDSLSRSMSKTTLINTNGGKNIGSRATTSQPGSRVLSKSMSISTSSSDFNSSTDSFSHPQSPQTTFLSPIQTKLSFPSESDAGNPKLIEELGKRSVTSRTGLRKLQHSVAANMGLNLNQPLMPKNNDSSDFAKKVFDDSYFIPKKPIMRPDGATLYDVYLSKKEDAWGQIIKMRAREEIIDKNKEKDHRYQIDENFRRQIRADMKRSQEFRNIYNDEDDKLIAIQNESSRKFEEMQQKRKADAKTAYIRYLNNALEDIDTRAKARHQELLKEMEANIVMISRDQASVAAEKQKQKERKEYEANLQAQLYQENLDFIARKEKEKKDQWAYEKSIIDAAEERFRVEDKRRRDELAKTLGRTTDGPAHGVTHKILQQTIANQELNYSKFRDAQDTLNHQLKASEDAAKYRASVDGKNLAEHWDKMNADKREAARQLELKNQQIQETMRKMIAKELEDVEQEKLRKHEEHMKYQRDLDAQLSVIRNRSLNALKETMTEDERKFNAQLVKRTTEI